MKKMVAAASPEAFVAALSGWRRTLVEALRAAARSVKGTDEVIKWGNIVYLLNGPVLMIRAEDERVLFGFWRGKRLTHIEPRLTGSGKYELRTLELREGMTIAPAVARRLVREAVALNRTVGNPTDDAKPRARQPAPKKKAPRR